MSDNPFHEPDDSDRTIIRPVPGGRAAAPAPAAFAPAVPRSAPPPAASTRLSEGTEKLAVGATPLAAAASPLLELLARLHNTAQAPDAGELRERAAAQLRAFEAEASTRGVDVELLRPAHYALCASLDDVVLNTPWGSGSAWAARSLVSTFHGEVSGGERFFDVLRKISTSPGRFLPAIELMYLCLSLGFLGRYRLSPRGPGEIEKIREETYALLARNRPAVPPELSPHAAGLDAPYRPGRRAVPLWVGAALAATAIVVPFVLLSVGASGNSDALYARLLSAPPSHMPALSRAPRTPPPPPPPSLVPTDADRLRGFLAPEIAQGLVSVVGSPAAPVVRINNRGMFGSGRATVEAAFLPLLRRIGDAVRDEPGTVDVVGYTDDQPIRTVAFPSNFALSTARAKAAARILAETAGRPARISAEGRADADPIASNATEAGREQNRRIEVVVNRTGG